MNHFLLYVDVVAISFCSGYIFRDFMQQKLHLSGLFAHLWKKPSPCAKLLSVWVYRECVAPRCRTSKASVQYQRWWTSQPVKMKSSVSLLFGLLVGWFEGELQAYNSWRWELIQPCQAVHSQRVCNVNDTSFAQAGRTINTQQDFDAYLGNCTTITGNLTIGPNYQGSLNISGTTRLDSLGHIAPPLNLTDILLSDVEHISYLRFEGATALRQMSAPKLTNAGSLEVQLINGIYLSFPALETVENVHLKGKIARYVCIVNHPGLATADCSQSCRTSAW